LSSSLKIDLSIWFSSKHGFIERCLKDALTEQGIDYVAPGYERAPKKRPNNATATVVANDVTAEYITHQYTEGGEEHEGLGDETIVFVALEDNQAQVKMATFGSWRPT
jgi:hypothetical protein